MDLTNDRGQLSHLFVPIASKWLRSGSDDDYEENEVF